MRHFESKMPSITFKKQNAKHTFSVIPTMYHRNKLFSASALHEVTPLLQDVPEMNDPWLHLRQALISEMPPHSEGVTLHQTCDQGPY